MSARKLRFVRTVPGGWQRESWQVGPDNDATTMPRGVPEMADADTIFVRHRAAPPPPPPGMTLPPPYTGNGTQERPYGTIREAIAQAITGGKDTVCILDSAIYNEFLDFKGHAIRVVAAGGEAPAIRYDPPRIGDGVTWQYYARDDTEYAVSCCVDDVHILAIGGTYPSFAPALVFLSEAGDGLSAQQQMPLGDICADLPSVIIAPYSGDSFALNVSKNTLSEIMRIYSVHDRSLIRSIYPPGGLGRACRVSALADGGGRLYACLSNTQEYLFAHYDKLGENWGRFSWASILEDFPKGLYPSEFNPIIVLEGSVLFFMRPIINPDLPIDEQPFGDAYVLRGDIQKNTITGYLKLDIPERLPHSYDLFTMFLPVKAGGKIYINLTEGVHRLEPAENGGIRKVYEPEYSRIFGKNPLVAFGETLTAITIRDDPEEGEVPALITPAGVKHFAVNDVSPLMYREDDGAIMRWTAGKKYLVSASGIAHPLNCVFGGAAGAEIEGVRIDGANMYNGIYAAGAKYCEICNTHTAITGAAIENSVIYDSGIGSYNGGDISRCVIHGCKTGVCSTGAKLRNATVTLCDVGVEIGEYCTNDDGPLSSYTQRSIVIGNVLDILGKPPAEGEHAFIKYISGSNIYRTSRGIMRAEGAIRVADMPLFVDYPSKDFSLRDRAHGYPYDSPGAVHGIYNRAGGCVDTDEDYGAYRVERSRLPDVIDLDESTDWLPEQIQCTHTLAQLATQDMMAGGLAVQHHGAWRQWALAWGADAGARRGQEQWEAFHAVLADLYRGCADTYSLLFGFAEGGEWIAERAVTVTTQGDRRRVHIADTQYAAPSVVMGWVHRYIRIGGGAMCRIASAKRIPGGMLLTTEEDAYEETAIAEQNMHLLEVYRAAVDPRRALAATQQASWSEAGYTGVDITLREVPT